MREKVDFKIVRAIDGAVMFRTTDSRCIYSDSAIASMKRAGYKAYLNGRIYRPTKKKGD